MRKSNVIIFAIFAIASVFFLWLWYYLQFNLVDNPLDLVLTIIWWVLIVVACVVIHKVEQKRQERMRTCYVSAGTIYNAEAGCVPTNVAAETIKGILSEMEYGFDIQDQPEDLGSYDYVVRSAEFELGDDGEVKTWKGEVASPAKPDAEPIAFASQADLQAILA